MNQFHLIESNRKLGPIGWHNKICEIEPTSYVKLDLLAGLNQLRALDNKLNRIDIFQIKIGLVWFEPINQTKEGYLELQQFIAFKTEPLVNWFGLNRFWINSVWFFYLIWTPLVCIRER